jgi:hypothetical protein
LAISQPPAGGSKTGRGGAPSGVGGMDDDADQMALRVGDDVSPAAYDLLAGVESARTAAFAGFRRLTVDDAGGRAGLAPILARRHDQRVIDRLPARLVDAQ